MNKVCFVISFVALCVLKASGVDAAPYTWSDLQALSSENNYQEYLDHALDVEPSKRDAAWKTVTESMGIKYLARLVEQTKMPEGSAERVERISEWPIFRSNEFFIKARDKYFLKKLSQCIELTPSSCEEAGIKMLNNFEHGITFPVEFLKIAKNIILTQEKRIQIAKPLLENKFSEFYCDNSPLREIVLIQISEKQSMNFDIHKDCLKKLLPEIEEIALGGNKFAETLLKRNSLMTKTFTQLSSIVSFLNIPEMPKELITQAIGTLDKLSKSINDRNELIGKIKLIDPLPGRIFAKVNKKTIGKLKLVERNFPEMIDLYAKTCLAYLTGETKFKFGNPTPECHQFFSMANHLKTIPPSYLNKYQQATKFMNK